MVSDMAPPHRPTSPPSVAAALLPAATGEGAAAASISFSSARSPLPSFFCRSPWAAADRQVPCSAEARSPSHWPATLDATATVEEDMGADKLDAALNGRSERICGLWVLACTYKQ